MYDCSRAVVLLKTRFLWLIFQLAERKWRTIVILLNQMDWIIVSPFNINCWREYLPIMYLLASKGSVGCWLIWFINAVELVIVFCLGIYIYIGSCYFKSQLFPLLMELASVFIFFLFIFFLMFSFSIISFKKLHLVPLITLKQGFN